MSTAAARILAVGTATPPIRYTQAEVLERFRVANPAVRKLFLAPHVRSRHLYLPAADAEGRPTEDQAALLRKHRKGALALGAQAIAAALEPLGLQPADVDYLCCVSSTGFMLPGISAMYVKHLGFRTSTHRADVVGMGCNAGLNGLNPVAWWAASHPGKLALMVCAEVNSALYIYDDTMATGVVNSLFGDGCAAVLVGTEPRSAAGPAPTLVDFESHLIPDTWDAMHYEWRQDHGKFSFVLDRDVPYVLGLNADLPVGRLLVRHGLRRRDVRHWLIHSGGRKVIDAIKYTVGITEHDVRHTVGVLGELGNLGSGSFLFSYQRLLREGVVAPGDWCVMMTMGPGSTIETALLRF